MNPISIAFIISAVTQVTFAGIISDAISNNNINPTCGNCYRLDLLGGEQHDSELDTTTFTYRISVSSDASCKSLTQISLALDNNCERLLSNLQPVITLEFVDIPGRSYPNVQYDEIIRSGNNAPKSSNNLINIDIDLKHKVNSGDSAVFSLTVGDPNDEAQDPKDDKGNPLWPRLGDRTKRSNADDTLIGLMAVDGNGNGDIEVCYTDVTLRLLPEICKDGGERSNCGRGTKGAFVCCDTPYDIDPCIVVVSGINGGIGACAAELEHRRGNPCDGEEGSDVPDPREGRYNGAVCIEKRSEVVCVSDDDCESQDRCFTLMGDDTSSVAECVKKVCGSTNLQ